MKRVRVLQQVQGTRNGVDWPEVGGTWELPDDEADAYERSGFVKVLAPQKAQHDPDKDVERAVANDPDVEVRIEAQSVTARTEAPAPTVTAKGPVTRTSGPVKP